jgi:hypothetical protein
MLAPAFQDQQGQKLLANILEILKQVGLDALSVSVAFSGPQICISAEQYHPLMKLCGLLNCRTTDRLR